MKSRTQGFASDNLPTRRTELSLDGNSLLNLIIGVFLAGAVIFILYGQMALKPQVCQLSTSISELGVHNQGEKECSPAARCC